MKAGGGRTYAARVWWDLSGRAPAVASLVLVLTLLILAALAPFLSLDRPFWLRDEAGALTFPFFRSLAAADVLWAGAAAAAAAGYLAWRLLPAPRGRRVGAAAAGLVLAAAGVVAATRTPYHEVRRFGREESLRRRLAEVDAKALGSGLRDAVSLGRALDAYAGLQRLTLEAHHVSDELEERFLAIQDTRPVPEIIAAIEAESRRNLAALERLEAAPFPLNRHDPGRPSLSMMKRPGEVARFALGTDADGRDLLANLLHGARTALTVAGLTALATAALGILLGGVAGYFRGRTDWVVMRLVETASCLPAVFLLVVIAAYLPVEVRSRPLTVVAFLTLLLWPHPARLVRAEVWRVSRSDFVLAARALGASHARILGRHVLPSAVAPLLVSATLTAGNVILVEATLSFLGLGVQSAPSWGRILHEAREAADLGDAWHLTVFPGLCVFLAVLSFNVLGDHLRDAADPRG